ncbi:ras guanine nucleotide exchange factor domain-containing protein, partial [Phlyctochytrium arcticum]
MADYEFIADFFVTYRLYLSPPELLSLIENRFKWALSQLEGDPYQKARNGCLIILHHWIKFHYDLDFVTSKPLRTAFGSFLVTDLESHPIIQNSSLYSRIVVVLKELIVDGRAKYRKRVREQRQLDQAQQTTSQQATTTPYENGGTIAPAHTQTTSDSHSFIRDYPPDQVARHLSMAEQRLINRVPWTELLDAKVWKSRTAGQAEGVWKVIERFNNTCKWVIDEVTFAEGTEDKVQLIEVFVRIAQACLAYSNFSTLLSILLALQKPGIRSLESCWANLAVGVLDTLRSLQEFSTPFQNFKGVRQ